MFGSEQLLKEVEDRFEKKKLLSFLNSVYSVNLIVLIAQIILLGVLN